MIIPPVLAGQYSKKTVFDDNICELKGYLSPECHRWKKDKLKLTKRDKDKEDEKKKKKQLFKRKSNLLLDVLG